ncbi:armadillo-type protein [Lipomyces oligophaga]|uniref:armadillo-type protein n=1 Tax=Lipomyces oligophaga TaxID=45792 RepID=UPI0034CDA7FA
MDPPSAEVPIVPWSQIRSIALTEVFSSSRKKRAQLFLSIASAAKTKETSSDLKLILHLLFSTYSLYEDHQSRMCVIKSLRALFESDPESVASSFIPALLRESEKQGMTSSDYFVLLEWANECLIVIASDSSAYRSLMEKWLPILSVIQSTCLDRCLSNAGEKKHRLARGSGRSTRVALNAILTGYADVCERYLDIIVAKPQKLSFASLLGLLIETSSDIKISQHAYKTIRDRKSEIIAYYTQEILGSKVFVGQHNAKAFNTFFADFLTEEDFTTEIAPPLERAILRSPELVLGPITAQLMKSLPAHYDCSVAVLKNLVNPCLSAMKSSKETIREAGLETICVLFEHCKDCENLSKIASELLSPLKMSKITSPEQRVLYVKALMSLPACLELSNVIPSGLIALANRETNELVTQAISSAMFYHAIPMLSSDSSLDKSISDCVLKGLNDKRANLRRYWIMNFGDLALALSSSSSPSMISFVSECLVKVLDSWKEVIANAMAAVQSKLIVTGYVTVTVVQHLLSLDLPPISDVLAKTKIIETALATGSKSSFFFMDRVYTKFVTAEEQTWAVKALSAVAGNISETKESGLLWGLAYIHFATSSLVESSVRQQNLVNLGCDFRKSPTTVGKSIATALWSWIRQLDDPTQKDQYISITQNGTKRLRNVLQAITPCGPEKVSKEIMSEILIDLLVVSHHSVLSFSQDWITLSQRAGVDPGELVASSFEKIKTILVDIASQTDQLDSIIDASMKAAATTAFVQPEIIAPFLRDYFTEDLDGRLLRGLSEQDVRIWHTSEGVMCIDVLSKDREKYAEDKNTKDYATLKWEAEVRAEIAKKAGPTQKKLTKDERIKVDQQLKKEKIVRDRVQNSFIHVRRAVKLIHFLADAGVENGTEIWFPAATKSLAEALKQNLSLLIGPVGIETFLELSSKVSARVGPLRQFIGVALLRAIEVSDIPEQYTQESLQDLIARILYRLRFLSEQIPLDTISLVYVLPLIMLILNNKGIGCAESEQADEQLMLAIETLTFHTDIFRNPSVPRKEILEVVIGFMKNYPAKNKTSKDCLLGLCHSIAANYSDDELKILLDATISSDSFVRASVLEGIDADLDISQIGYSNELWISCHDEIELNSRFANSIWDESGLAIDESTPSHLLPYLGNLDAGIRGSTSRAIAESLEALMKQNETIFHDFLVELMKDYCVRAEPPPTIYDEYGMVLKTSLDQKDPWEGRSGIAGALKEIASFFPEAELVTLVTFLIEDGPLGDREPMVRQEMQEAAVLILDLHAKNSVGILMPILEKTLRAKHTGAEEQDRIKECAIVLYGTLARHLDNDEDLPPIIERLIATLRAPSENVQFAVSESLPPLVKRVSGDNIEKYVKKLLDQLLAGNRFSERRGAAFGLAGLVKGVGISALSDYDIIRTLSEAIEDKKDPKKRQGVQFAIETLSLSLGRYFEPYAIEVLPLILSSLGDMSPEVREATSDAAKEIMKHTTSFGIKQLIPLTLDAFNQSQWRAKKGAVELLGTMAYLDPRQLSESLSDIIPEIVGALNDTHKEVRKAASQSLQRFGEVIRNPEIQSLVPILLKAISDPTRFVDNALDSLLKTSFVHYIDAPSLALIVYILERGLRERSASTKRKACQIVGNMASLTDSKDLIPYLDELVRELEISMVDPVPATRGTASQALGSLVEKLGEEQMPNLIPKLIGMLRADSNEGDRLGAAQALSEVISGLGVRKLEDLLPLILKNISSSKPNIRESFMNLMIFLPAAFGTNFSPFLANVIPYILAGLADDVEAIRDISLRAGRLIVKNYATRAVDLLLPELERGLSDENYRIRLSSIELTGDLLFQITGISGSPLAQENEDDDNTVGEVHASLNEILGTERRDRILAALYVCRSDVTAVVRNAALEVWKSLVSNTPRTVKDILPILAQTIIKKLSSLDDDQRENASQTLSELVRRFGESLLMQFLPILENGLYSNDSEAKQGICVALSELIEATPQNVLEVHEKMLMAFIRTALVDPDANVREAAAHAFDTLQEVFGDSTIDQVLPHLLNLLQTSGQSEYALAALKEIMSSKSEVIFPVLIPILLNRPISAFNARAMGSLAEVAGSTLYRRLQSIIESLVDSLLEDGEPDETKEAIEEAIDSIMGSVEDEDGIELVTDIFLELAEDETPKKRALAFTHMATYFENSDVDDFSEYVGPWITHSLNAFVGNDEEVVASAWKCLSVIVVKLPKEGLLEYVVSTSRQLQGLGQAGENMPGFARMKGPSAVLPIFSQGLMYGTTDQREAGARGIGYIVERTPVDILRPFVALMVGPLIRIVGERFPGEVKVAILDTLAILLEKIPAFLRPFLPQLQRTFTKSIADPASAEELQESAQKALDVLTSIQGKK